MTSPIYTQKHLLKSVWLTLVFLVVTITCSAQDIKVLGSNSFEYANTTYNRYTLRSVMERKPEALVQYDRYIKVHDNARLRRNAGGGAMIGGALLTFVAAASAINNNSGVGLAYVALTTTGLGALLVISSFVRKRHLLNKAIDIYNSEPPDIGMLQPQVDLGLTANGVGVVYRF